MGLAGGDVVDGGACRVRRFQHDRDDEYQLPAVVVGEALPAGHPLLRGAPTERGEIPVGGVTQQSRNVSVERDGVEAGGQVVRQHLDDGGDGAGGVLIAGGRVLFLVCVRFGRHRRRHRRRRPRLFGGRPCRLRGLGRRPGGSGCRLRGRGRGRLRRCDLRRRRLRGLRLRGLCGRRRCGLRLRGRCGLRRCGRRDRCRGLRRCRGRRCCGFRLRRGVCRCRRPRRGFVAPDILRRRIRVGRRDLVVSGLRRRRRCDDSPRAVVAAAAGEQQRAQRDHVQAHHDQRSPRPGPPDQCAPPGEPLVAGHAKGSAGCAGSG